MPFRPEFPLKKNMEVTEDRVPAVIRMGKNLLGKDYVVGDVHGMFTALEQLLAQVDFDMDKDRLFCVGDLVDRGPKSAEALDWLEQRWFFACRGNHEHFAINSLDAEELSFWIDNNGGEWWLDLSPEDQEMFRQRLLEMPLAIEVETNTGVVGIVHADIPPRLNWEEFCEQLRQRDEEVIHYALFSRNRIHGTHTNLAVETSELDRFYCGHTPVREVQRIENVSFIDTAAVYAKDGYDSARLTMIEIQPSRHREISIHTDAWI